VENGCQYYYENTFTQESSKAAGQTAINALVEGEVPENEELGEYAEFISKPVQPAALMKKVRDMLER